MFVPVFDGAEGFGACRDAGFAAGLALICCYITVFVHTVVSEISGSGAAAESEIGVVDLEVSERNTESSGTLGSSDSPQLFPVRHRSPRLWVGLAGRCSIVVVVEITRDRPKIDY